VANLYLSMASAESRKSEPPKEKWYPGKFLGGKADKKGSAPDEARPADGAAAEADKAKEKW